VKQLSTCYTRESVCPQFAKCVIFVKNNKWNC